MDSDMPLVIPACLRVIFYLIISSLLIACGGSSDDEDNHDHGNHHDDIEQDVDFHKHSLIDNNNWQFTPEDQDPLSELRPVEVDCPTAAWGFENGTLEVQTGVCNYLSVSQETRVEIDAGQELHIILYHADLIADEPAEGYAALLVNDTIIWDITVPIPHDPANYDVTVDAPVDIRAGDIITFHLHNHGFNSWNLLIIEPGENEEHHHVEE